MGNGFKLNETTKNKINAAGDPVVATKVLEGQDPFSIDYSGISNLDPVVISNKKISKKEQKKIVAEEKSSKKPATWSSEVDLINEEERYQAVMNPLIADYKKSVTGAMDKAAGVILEAGLFAAPVPYIPGSSTAIKAIGGFANRIMNPIAKTIKPNLSFSTLTPTSAATSGTAISSLPNLPPLFGRFQSSTRQGMFDALTVAAKGADVSKAGRLQVLNRLSTGEGRKRLFNQEFDFLKSQADEYAKGLDLIKFGKTNPQAYFNTTSKGQRMSLMKDYPASSSTLKLLGSTENMTKQAWKNVGHRIAEISKPNVNELAAKSIAGGKLNYSLGKNVLYTSEPKQFYNQMLKQRGIETNFAKSFLTNQATYGGFRSGRSGFGFDPIGIATRTSKTPGTFALGSEGGLMNLKTYMHETAHGLQKGVTGNIDRALAKITPNRSIASQQNKINKLITTREEHWNLPTTKESMSLFSRQGDQLTAMRSKLKQTKGFKDYDYFKYGGRGQMEPSAFAAEARQSLLERGFIKSDYSKITPNILSKAKTSFGKNPLYQGNVQGNIISGTRLLDFMAPTKSNFSILSKQLNKLPAFAPFIGLGALSGGKKK